MHEQYFQKTFDNGLTLVAERITTVESAAMTLLVPAGSATDPRGRLGAATVLSDLILRGAGSRGSRELTDYLDFLGLQRSSSASVYHVRLGAAGLAESILDGLAVYADMARRPHLPAEGFHASRELSVQAIDGIEDEPRQKLTIELRRRHLPDPLGRNTMGERKDLLALTAEEAAADFRRRFQPRGTILAVAGKIEFEPLAARVEGLLGDWAPVETEAMTLRAGARGYHHEMQESEQTHIGIAWDSVPETHPDTYVVRLAAEVLGGGMSGRLFTEVREKRGLCYSVGAGYSSLKDLGFMMGYAGTSNERAQATLECFMAELQRLRQGIAAEELARAKTAIESAIIMQGESTSSRSSAIAHDYFVRQRLRTIEEIKREIDVVTLERVNALLAANAPGPFTIVTVGPRPLSVPA